MARRTLQEQGDAGRLDDEHVGGKVRLVDRRQQDVGAASRRDERPAGGLRRGGRDLGEIVQTRAETVQVNHFVRRKLGDSVVPFSGAKLNRSAPAEPSTSCRPVRSALPMDVPVWDVTVVTGNRERLLAGEIAIEFLLAVITDPTWQKIALHD